MKAWLVDQSRLSAPAPLIGTHIAKARIQEVDISCSGMWAVTLDETSTIEVHKVDTTAMSLECQFRLDSSHPNSRFDAICGIVELTSPRRVILAVSDTCSHVIIYELGSEKRQINSTNGNVAMLSPNSKLLYTTNQYRGLSNPVVIITRIYDTGLPYTVDLGQLPPPNKIDASPTGDLLLALKHDDIQCLRGWQLEA